MKTYRIEKAVALFVSAEGAGKDWYWSFLNWEGPGGAAMDTLAAADDEPVVVDAVVTRDGDDFLIQGSTDYHGCGEAVEVRVDKRFVTAVGYNYEDEDDGSLGDSHTFLPELTS
ncbi:hypothetical protein LCGC14_2497100 [marine sediment metagenome]|uniref:Uncharacterized protein n=1 Tax=marine sediment metagenome TaxID=412755 RepID=A0A0F9DES8_9ZZZZ